MEKEGSIKIRYIVLLVFLIVLSIVAAVAINKYIGYATMVESEAGTITELRITKGWPTWYWGGIYGVAVMDPQYDEQQFEDIQPSGIEDENLIFDCFAPYIEHEVYASTESSLDWSTILAAPTSMVDAFMGVNASNLDSGTSTFTGVMTVEVGLDNISNVPATRTKNATGDNETFDLGILNVSGSLVFVTHRVIYTYGFSGKKTNYQLMLPVPNATTRFYFYRDPFDECPAGYGMGFGGDSEINGYVKDSSSDAFIVNATISVSGITNYSGADGYYVLVVPTGNHTLLATKDDYDAYITNITTVLASSTTHNISMDPIYGLLRGHIENNNTGVALENVTISIRGVNNLSEADGNYTVKVKGGPHNLIAFKDGFDTYSSNSTIIPGNETEHNFNMSPVRDFGVGNGTVAGFVTDNITGLPIEGASVSAGGASDVTDENGSYTFNLSSGPHTIVSLISGYENYIGNVTILNDETTDYNISMMPTSGVVWGYVLDSNSSVPIANVSVTIGSVTNTTDENGTYFISQSTGNYSIIATVSGYNSYVGNVSVQVGTTYMNLTLESITGVVYGFVVDNSTKERLAGVNVSLAGASTLTNSTGGYELNVTVGTHNIVADLDGFNAHIGEIRVRAGWNVKYNISLAPLNGTLTGFIIDYSTSDPIPNATVHVGGMNITTDINGSYTINLSKGLYTVLGTAPNFYTHVGYASIDYGQTTIYNISLAPMYGIVYGTVMAEGGALLDNVTVSAGGNSTVTDAVGDYSFTVPVGIHNIVAVRTGYNNYANNVTVNSGESTLHNIVMSLYVAAEAANGTLYGLVTENGTGDLISNATISIAGVIVQSNGSGYYSLSATGGVHNLVALKTGYQNYADDVTIVAGNNTEYNISLTEQPEEEEEIIVTDGLGEGAGAGAGEGTGVTTVSTPRQPIVETPTEVVEYELSVQQIIKKMRQGTFVDVPIIISNHKKSAMNIDFEVEGEIESMIRLDKTDLTIPATTSEGIEMTILANKEVGVYNGSLKIKGDIEDEIPIYILVYNKEKLPVEALLVKLGILNKKLYQGNTLKFRVDLQNLLLEEEYKVGMRYNIKGLENNVSIPVGEDNVTVHTAFSVLKTYKLPEDLPPGEYLLELETDYFDVTSKYTSAFIVKELFYKYALFGIIPIWILLIVAVVLSSGTMSVLVYKRQKAKKKRYRIAVDYSQLPKEGERSAYVGTIAETEHHTNFDLDKFQIHTIVAGASGSGKTIAAQVLVEEALMKGAAVIVFDPTGQWTGFLRKCQDKKLLATYGKFGMKTSETKSFNGNVYQVTDAYELLDIKKFMKAGEINVFVTNKLSTPQVEIFVANTIREIFHANLPEEKQLKFVMVYDGIHSLLPRFGGSGKVFIQVERATREFRKWGVGLILVSQVLSDFTGEVKANINTEIQLRTRDEGDIARIKEEYGEDILKSVVKASVGTGMVENAAYNRGKPYFVSFRPVFHGVQRIGEEELQNYNKFNGIIDEIEFQIDQLEKLGIDTFDLKLELKLAKDKIKSGSFNMVNIYLEGLTPRIDDQWKKLGKKPKQMVKRRVTEEELAEEAVAAKKAKKKEKPKEEKPAEPKKEAPNEADVPSRNEMETVAKMIEEAYGYIGKGDKQKAKETYSKVMGLYKNLSKEQKAQVVRGCVELQSALTQK
ncbi:MAG: DUF853 family protein [bacterium]|nr:DUF853 family protein [bacterium]